MGTKLSRLPDDVTHRHHHVPQVPDAIKTSSWQQPAPTTAGAPTTHHVASATAGLLAALRWKKVTHQRRSRRAAETGNKSSQNQLPATVSAGGVGVWAKLIRHLSRKMAGGRRRQRGGRDHPEAARGTSSVLPVSRNPVTSVAAYGDDTTLPSNELIQRSKDRVDVNSNVADIVRRITISTRCEVRRDVTDYSVTQAPVTSSVPDDGQIARSVPRKTIQIQASTGELLAGLGEFLRCRCRRLRHFDGTEVAAWLRGVDRSLIEHAWQDTPFIGPANLVLVYLLANDAVDPDIITTGELQAVVMACLYVAFSYAGAEISYPLKPFISSAGVDEVSSSSTSGGPGKKRFWNRCLTIIERSSGEMLRLNREPSYFAELFRELKTYAASSSYQVTSTTTTPMTSSSRPRDSSAGQSNGAAVVTKHRCHGNEE